MQNTLIIGDIHACYRELAELLDRAAIGDDDLVVSVGDLVDRGPDPEPVLALFQTRASSVAICGNHERKHVRNVLSYSQQVTREQLGDRYAAHVTWMATLPYRWERTDVRVVHYGMYPGVPLADTPEDVLAGTTSGEARLAERFGEGRWWYEQYDDDVPVVFGHHVVGKEPLVIRDRVYGIDTGACHGGRLTGLLLPERRLVQVDAREDYWARVRKQWQVPVMKRLDWSAMTFEQINKKLRSLADPELEASVLDRVAVWLDGVLAALPALREALDAEVARIAAEAGDDFGRVAATHPAASWLQRRRAGKLSSERLGCATPEHVVRLARALGAKVEAAPF
jgi:serine/threonine protein phosphatase 1